MSDKIYGDQVMISPKLWNKESLWNALELQRQQYNDTKDELREKGIELRRPYWEIHMPFKGGADEYLFNTPYWVKWFASGQSEQEND